MGLKDSYLTIAGKSEGFYKEKGSKFLAFAFPVSNESEIKEALDLLRKEYYDARHHCYGYIYGHHSEHLRANDDGEPGHSAGDPILGQIKSRELTNVLVVVVRYFGGTKLGVSGLIHAYKTAAAEALEAAGIVKCDITEQVSLHFPYDEMNQVMKLIKDLDLQITQQGYNEQCVIELSVVVSRMAPMEGKIDLMQKTGSAVVMKKTGK